ncbi:hypothetical protein M407DRAFT_19436 [Tulasnella calospora MUT 4182]|uniref:Uncharacterized protein n=1 Tax=Tulasnella calospora MUT 4182 TaxID=1051891 RepID=A0A0C3LC58_9AGAM|nr:hypothetical protein M407DRAFT_19436 [Tulasnella calospora MUT 4182]
MSLLSYPSQSTLQLEATGTAPLRILPPWKLGPQSPVVYCPSPRQETYTHPKPFQRTPLDESDGETAPKRLPNHQGIQRLLGLATYFIYPWAVQAWLMKKLQGSNRQSITPRPTAPLPRARQPGTTPLGGAENTNETSFPPTLQSGHNLTSNVPSSRSPINRANVTWSSPATFARGSRQPPPNPGGSSHEDSSSSSRLLNVTRKTGGNQAGASSRRPTKASRGRRPSQTSSQRRTLPQPLGPSSDLEELLNRARYSVTPQLRRQLIRGKFQASGYDLYDEVPSVPRPVAPRPVDQQLKKPRRKIRRGFEDEDLSDEELDVGHLPLTNPSYTHQLTSNTDRPTLRKATTTARVQEDRQRDKPVRGAKKMSASRESYGVNPLTTALPVEDNDEEIVTQDVDIDPFMLMGGSDEEQEAMDYLPTGSPRPLFLPDDLDLPHAFLPPSSTIWAKRPVTPLIEAFEEVDMDARYRIGVQTVSGRLPFLKRNMRAIFERRAQRRRNLKASAAGYPEVGAPQPPNRGRLYDLGLVLDEESILKRSRRAKKIVLQLERLYLPTNYAPHACNITVELHLKKNEGLAMRLSLLDADITIPRPQQEQGARYAINFQPPLRATSELLTFWSIPPPFTAFGATVVITLSGFQGSGGRPLPWVLPGSASSPAGVGEKAEICLEVVSDDEPALFVSAERKVVPLEWIEGRNLPQQESNSLMTATLSLTWEFEPTGYSLPPLKTLQESQAPLVVVEFRHNDNVWKTKQIGWRCPLCDRFGAFSDPFFLECHLQVHHERVEPVIDEDAARMPRIILTARPLQ